MPKKRLNNDRLVAEQVSDQVYSMSDHIRYVAVYYHGKLQSVSKPGLARLNLWDLDKYDELIVNPTLITLLRQRGNIDCGGIRQVIIEYRDIVQFVHPINGGHLSVGFAPLTDYTRFIPKITKLLRDKKLIAENRQQQGDCRDTETD